MPRGKWEEKPTPKFKHLRELCKKEKHFFS